MPKGNYFSKKEFYSLLWKYLKRSPDYEKFCEWAGRKEKESIGGSLYPLNDLDTTDLPAEFKCGQKGKFHPFFDLYLDVLFGDIRFRTFEYFEQIWNILEEISRRLPLVESYSETFEEDFDDVLAILRCKNRKPRSLDELIKDLQGRGNLEGDYASEVSADVLKAEIKEMLKYTPGRIVLKIRIDRTQDIQNLQKEISKFLTRELKTRLKNDWQKERWWIQRPTESRTGKNIKRFLDVYILRYEQNKEWEEIFDIIYPEIAQKLSDPTISYRRKDPLIMNKDSKIHSFGEDIRNFKRIIKNLSRGTFPGKYRF